MRTPFSNPAYIKVSNFGDYFVQMAELYGVHVSQKGIGCIISSGLGELLNNWFLQTLGKLMTESTSADRDNFLTVSVKEMNDTLGRDGRVQSTLFLGKFPPTLH